MIMRRSRQQRCAVDEQRIKRLHRSIKGRVHPVAVVLTDNDDFDLVPWQSVRLEALLRSPKWAARVVGVFSPAVTLDDLRSAVRS